MKMYDINFEDIRISGSTVTVYTNGVKAVCGFVDVIKNKIKKFMNNDVIEMYPYKNTVVIKTVGVGV